MAIKLTLLDIEQKAKKIYDNRKKVETLNAQIGTLRDEILQYMKETDKRILKVGDLSLEIKHRDKRFADYSLIQHHIDKGILPQEILKTSKIETLNIVSVKDFKLEGNKFVVK